jgi:Xaa-Pro dipeptidase
MTNMELGGCRHRYHTPLCRSIYLGDPPPEMKRTAEVVVEALTAALDTVKAGVTCEEVEAAWRRVLTRHGLEKESRIGYPVGIGYPPTWGELTASLRPGDRTVMESDMTFHSVPAIWKDDWGVVISETFRVTETGAETFCNFPRRLFWKS